MLPTPSCFRKFLFCLASCCILVAFCLPVFNKTFASNHSVPVAYDVFFEDAPAASISQIAAPQFSNVFTPLAHTPIPHSVKRVWIRISIPVEQIKRWRMNDFFPFMQFGGLVRRPTTLFYRPASNPQRWQSSAITRSHIPLPDASKTGVAEYFLSIEGKPGIWFTPEITLQNIAMPTFPTSVFFWLLIGLTLGIAGLNFFLAVFTKAESCFWLCVYTLLTIGYYTLGSAPSAVAGLEFTTAWTILLPGLALIILPHIGRNLFYKANCPRFIDAQLWGMSLLGLLVAIIPLIPGLSSTLHYLPLWPTLAILGTIPGIAAISRRITGGKRFTAACVLTALGSLFALLPAHSADIAGILQLMPFAGVAMGLMILTPIALFGAEVQPNVTNSTHDNAGTFTPQNLIQKISHDLQSPLVTIASMGEKLQSVTIPDEGEHALRTLQSATHVLQLQLKDLLDLNRADSHRLALKKRNFDLQSMLKDTYNIMLPHTEGKGLTLTWRISPDLPIHFIGDSSRLIQVLLNLLGNAVRFSDSGTISIAVSSLSSTEKSTQLLFTVKDEGRGIPLQNKYDVLDRFCQEPEQNSGKYCGAGLGLSVTTELVHLMDGFLCIESEPNIGTTISFTVRLENYDKAQFTSEEHAQRLPIASTKKDNLHNEEAPQLLVIETRTMPTESIAQLLDTDTFHAHEVRSFDEAVTTYEEFATDVVIVAAELTEDAITILSQLVEIDKKLNSTPAPAIAIANSPVSAELLCDSGYSQALTAPATEASLLSALTDLGLHETESEAVSNEPEDFEDENTFDESDIAPPLEPLSLSGLTIDSEPEPEPEPIALSKEHIIQEDNDDSDDNSNLKKQVDIDYDAYANQEEEEHIDLPSLSLETNETEEKFNDEMREDTALPELNEKDIEEITTSLEELEQSLRTPSEETKAENSEEHDEYTFEEIPPAESETDQPVQGIITAEEEEYVKEILHPEQKNDTTFPEPPLEKVQDDLLLDETPTVEEISEEKNSVTPPPLFSFDELEDEDKEALFERIAQEKKQEAAENQVTSDNQTAYSSIAEEKSTVWNDAPLTEAVSHLTLNSDEAVHPAEVLDIVFLPLIPKIISQLQETFEDISLQMEQDSMQGILQTADKLQQQAQKYALREVDKMASCVARAAEAEDKNAVTTLMNELEATVIQTGKALRDVYKHSAEQSE